MIKCNKNVECRIKNEEFMKFECEKCGRCCKNLKGFIEAYQIDFPYKPKEDGSCEMLGEDNLCKVYENRPITCNLEKFGKVLKMDEKEWYELNKKGCEMLREQENDFNDINDV